MSKRFIILLICLLGFILSKSLFAYSIKKAPNGNGQASLAERWDWAQKQATLDQVSSFQVVYTVRRLMHENEMMGSFFHDDGQDSTVLADVLYGWVGGTQERQARTGSGAKVWKEVAIIAEFAQVKNKLELRHLQSCTIDTRPALQNDPIYMLGLVEVAQSVNHLQTLFMQVKDEEQQEQLVAAMGLHADAALVLPFLERVLAGKHGAEVRRSAAFWAGEQESEASVKLLVRLERQDRDPEVREAAIFSLSRLELPLALNQLIMVAKNEKNEDLQKNAIFWLSQKAAQKACDTLEEIASDDDQESVQEQAIFALSQHEQGVASLIKIATGQGDKRLKKKAIFWLGQSEDPKALQVILDILGK